MSVRRALAAVLVPAVLLLPACSEDEPVPIMPEPDATSSAPTPTETPTVDPLAIPAEAKVENKKGAGVMVRHYFEMVNHLWATGDSKPIRRLYGDRCSFCETPTQIVEFAQSKGHTFVGSEEILSMEVVLLERANGILRAVAFVDATQTDLVERNANGKLLVTYPAVKRGSREYYLAFQKGKWEITNVEEAE